MPRDVINKSKWAGERAPRWAWWLSSVLETHWCREREPAPGKLSSDLCMHTVRHVRTSPHTIYKNKMKKKREEDNFKVRVYAKFYTRTDGACLGITCPVSLLTDVAVLPVPGNRTLSRNCIPFSQLVGIQERALGHFCTDGDTERVRGVALLSSSPEEIWAERNTQRRKMPQT